MKNLFKNLMLVAVAAMAFTACTETNDEVNANVEKRVFKFVAGFADDTRSGFLEKEESATAYKSEWFGDETLKLFVSDNNDYYVETTAPISKEGKFTLELTDAPESFDMSVCSPAESWVNENTYNIPTEQTPSANSVDPAAHILKAENVAVNSGVVTMSHAVAYGKMTVNAPTSFAISYVEVSFNDGTPYVIDAKNVENNTFWFATEPAEVSELTVKAYNADGKAVAKVVDMTGREKPLAFNVGKVSTFSVSGLKAVVEQSSYVLVTDAANLEAGDEVVIAAAASDMAMGASRGNNFSAIGVTKDGNTIVINNDVLIFTLETGNVADTYAFKTTDGYLYAASSSSNHLKTQATNDDNGSWSITIADGIATVKAQGENERNWMRFNSSNNPKIFSCYANGQTDISIYKKYSDYSGNEVADPLFELDVTELSFKADGESKEVNVIPLNYFEAEVTATPSANWLSIENDGYKYTVTAEENEDAERTATITFSADGCKDVVVDVKQNTSIVESVTVVEFLAADVNENVYYRLQGTITGMYQNNDNDYKYGNFYLTDDTGTVLIYGLYSPDGKTDKYWATSEAQVGNDIIVEAARGVYNNNPQGVKARFVELLEGTRAFWSFDKDSVSFGYEGGEAEIKVDAYNLTENVEWDFKDGTMFDADYVDGVVYITAYENQDEEAYEDILYVTCGDLSQEIALTLAANPGEGGAKTWVRVTSTDMILSGGTFIIGYEATAKSGKLVPMRSDASGAKTTANGYHYSGTGTGTTSNNGTIDMTTIDVTKTEKYEFTISASTNVSGAIDIKRPDGNYIGNNNGKNTARLFTAPSEKTAYGVSMGSNDVVTLTCAAATGYPTLQYNASSPRFANYNKSQKNLVLYKLQ